METVICHIDVNSAYLSWTAAYRCGTLGEAEDLRLIPAAIGGDSESRHGIILAKSGPAKARGVKTGEPIYQARLKCPELVVAPPDFSLYAAESRRFIAFLKEMAPRVEQYSIDEAWIDISGTQALYGPPIQAAATIKNRIRDELGFTVNIGVSCNKILAKMASDFEKPDKVHTLFPGEMRDKLWPLPVRQLFMVGPATEKKLQAMGIRTIGQLAQADPARLKLRLHKYGEMIWRFANGQGSEALQTEAGLNKGYSNSVTTEKDVTTWAEGRQVLLGLAESVGARIRLDNQVGSCVGVLLRTSSFQNLAQQQQLAAPTDATLEIYRAACVLFQKLWDGRTPLRLLGLSLSRTSPKQGRQASLFNADPYDKLSKADQAVDRIRASFGQDAILRASQLQPSLSPFLKGQDQERRHGLTKPWRKRMMIESIGSLKPLLSCKKVTQRTLISFKVKIRLGTKPYFTIQSFLGSSFTPSWLFPSGKSQLCT